MEQSNSKSSWITTARSACKPNVSYSLKSLKGSIGDCIGKFLKGGYIRDYIGFRVQGLNSLKEVALHRV